MQTLSNAAGAPLSIDNIAAEFSPLTLGDLAEIERWATERTIAEVKAKIQFLTDEGAPPTPEEKRDLLTKAWDSTKNGRATGAQLVTLDGTRLQAKLSLRHKRPDITDEQVNQLVTVENMQRVLTAIDRSVDGEAPPNAGTAPADSSSPSPELIGQTSTEG